MGELLLTKFLLPFEAASFLLLIAAVGAVVLARRRGGLEDEADAERRISVYDVVRPQAPGRWPRRWARRSACPTRASEERDRVSIAWFLDRLGGDLLHRRRRRARRAATRSSCCCAWS